MFDNIYNEKTNLNLIYLISLKIYLKNIYLILLKKFFTL